MANITSFGLFAMPATLFKARLYVYVTTNLNFCFAFQDDLDRASPTEEMHKPYLHQIISRLQHSLLINVEKCASSINFLGQKVEAASVQPLPNYVEESVDLPPPPPIGISKSFWVCSIFIEGFFPD